MADSRPALIARLEQSWYGQVPPPWWTLPLSAIYAGLSGGRRVLYRLGVLRSVRVSVPVVVIGNISVGGTGKTPLTIALAQALQRRGYQVGVVSRGYGGSQREPLWLDASPDPNQVGDEPCLIRASGVPVAVGRDRVAAARLLVGHGCDVILADDGLQHYRLARDLEIGVIDGVRRFGNGRLLPAGPLREPPSRMRQVTWRICHGGLSQADEIAMQLRGGEVCRLVDDAAQSLDGFAAQRVHAVAAIGYPQRFFASLRAAGIDVIEHSFADHHAFVASELDFGDGLPVLMTDKDAVKCRPFAQPNWWRVPVHAVLPECFYETVASRLRQAHTKRGDDATCR